MLSKSILIADDDRLVRESLADMLGSMGCSTREAHNGTRAMSILNSQRFDLLLSDVDMPDMTGFQLLDWVRQHPPVTPTVLMSARADAALSAEAQRNGAAAMLAKPVDLSVLSRLLSSLFPASVS